MQRLDYNVLVPYLQPKHEYVLSISMTDLQRKLYKHYLENFAKAGQVTCHLNERIILIHHFVRSLTKESLKAERREDCSMTSSSCRGSGTTRSSSSWPSSGGTRRRRRMTRRGASRILSATMKTRTLLTVVMRTAMLTVIFRYSSVFNQVSLSDILLLFKRRLMSMVTLW